MEPSVQQVCTDVKASRPASLAMSCSECTSKGWAPLVLFSALSRIPVDRQKQVASALLWVAGISGLGSLFAISDFLKSSEEECSGILVWQSCTKRAIEFSERGPHLLLAILLAAAAIACLLLSLRLVNMQSDVRRYHAVLTGVESISIQEISAITGARPDKVRAEIQWMIDSDQIRDCVVDYSGDRVLNKRYIPERSHKTVVTCSACGADNELIVGIVKSCSFCGRPLKLGNP